MSDRRSMYVRVSRVACLDEGIVVGGGGRWRLWKPIG
jgi:hypothetical protein